MSKKLKPASRRCRHRRVIPGTTYLLTKKTNDDLLLIRPSDGVNQILLYGLILKALRYGVRIHGFCFMSNHFHLVMTDVRGRLPAFMRDCLSDTSKALQIELGVDRPIWSRRRYSDVNLLDLDAAERKIVYTILNPTRAGLTEPADWPGLNSVKWKFGDKIKVKRPSVYFSKRYQPEEVSIVLEPVTQSYQCPPAVDGARAEQESKARIQSLIDQEVADIHVSLENSGRSLAGTEKAMKVSREQRGGHPVRMRNPRFATRNRELLSSAIADARRFEEEHERAREHFIAGHHGTVFPAGTYGYLQLFGVKVKDWRMAA